MANKCSELSPWNYRMDYESKRVHHINTKYPTKIDSTSPFQTICLLFWIVHLVGTLCHLFVIIILKQKRFPHTHTHTRAKCAILVKEKEGPKVSLYLKINQISFIWVNETPHLLVQFWIVFVHFKIFITVNTGNMFIWIS